MTDKEKIELIIQDKHLNNTEFCNEVCIAAGTLSHILSGRTQPTLNTLRNISQAFPDINPAWLFYDAGPMYINVDSSSPSSDQRDGSPAREQNVEQEVKNDQMSLFPFPTDAPSSGKGARLPGSVPVQASAVPVGGSRSSAPETSHSSLDVAEIVAATLKQQQRPPRKVLEVRIFFDDGTFETFGPQ